jgi:Fe-S cluster biogenesis protein NfuA
MSDAAKMQEASGRERIRFATSPLDPLAGRFTLERSLTRAPLHFPDAAAAEGAPLAAALFAAGGVRAVQIADGVVTVTRAVEASWDGLKAPLAAAIRAGLTLEAPLGADGARPSVGRRSDAELRESVQTVLDRAANPAIAAHGGRVDVVDVVDGELWLRMSGGCQGCAASTATLRDGVERMVRAAVPEIVRIVDVTDHHAGLSPYYSHESGAAASPLARAVPEGVISLEDGRHVVDSAHLAPRLGLDVEALRVEMHAGRVHSREDRGEGEDADCVRLTFRHGDRAWSALIRPDGRIVETPPPLDPAPTDPEHDAALAAGVRALLEALPPDSPPVGYAQLADALDVSPPHRVGQVARALEITMDEDAAAGRPFLAALVVGRARDGLPARGFYDRAAALGRGPEPGETEAAFYDRELAATQAWLAGRPSNAPPRGAWRRWFRQRVGRRSAR